MWLRVRRQNTNEMLSQRNKLLSKIWFEFMVKNLFLTKLVMSPLNRYRQFVGHVLIYRKHVDLERRDGYGILKVRGQQEQNRSIV
jgi:hypothetical protein